MRRSKQIRSDYGEEVRSVRHEPEIYLVTAMCLLGLYHEQHSFFTTGSSAAFTRTGHCPRRIEASMCCARLTYDTQEFKDLLRLEFTRRNVGCFGALSKHGGHSTGRDS